MALKLKSAAAPSLRTVDRLPTSVSAPSPYLGGLSNLGSPGIDAVRAAAQTAGMAKRAANAPGAPPEARSPISKIRVRRKKFRAASSAPSGGFSLPAAKF